MITSSARGVCLSLLVSLGCGSVDALGRAPAPTEVDASTSDATLPPTDATLPPTDATLPPTDATLRTTDAGDTSPDAGTRDAEVIAPDAEPGPLVPPAEPMRLVLGLGHTCALLARGAVRCWGEGYVGQLGYGNTAAIGDDEPARAAGDVPITDVVQLAAGQSETCALSSRGQVRCWGVPSPSRADQAVRVPLSGPAVQVDTLFTYACAVLQTGAVECWDAYVGVGVAEVPIGRPAVEVQVGREHACARTVDGAVRCWGTGSYGALGYGNPDALAAPTVDVPLGGRATAIGVGSTFSCALLDTGAVRCWGSPELLGYGDGVHVGVATTPAVAGDLRVGGGRVVQLAVGSIHACARLEDGAVRCWGSATLGRSGSGAERSSGDYREPGPPLELGGRAVELAAGGVHACAQLEDSTVRCWGHGGYGSLGYGHTRNIGDDETPSSAGPVPIE